MKPISTAIGLTMAATGLAKLLRILAYEGLVQDLDWSDQERQAIGLGELVGGLMMLAAPTRPIGKGLVLAVSGAALSVEMRGDQTQLATPRAALMVAALLTGASA